MIVRSEVRDRVSFEVPISQVFFLDLGAKKM